jgi:hypothetical protein
VVLVAPVHPILVRGGNNRVRTLFGDDDQAGRVTKWKRTEQDGIDHAEDGGIRADAEGQGENGDEGESGISGENAERIAQIVQDGIHGGPLRA